MALRHFGAASIFVVPIGGGTPFKVGTLQDVTVTIKRDKKKMFGRGSFPVEIGLGQGEATVKAKSGQIQASIISLLTGVSASTGNTMIAEDEIGTVGSGGQIAPANQSTLIQDLGVRYKAGGAPLQSIASGTPVAGQYKVSTLGAYVFAVSEAGTAMKFSYAYGVTGSGQSMRVANPIQGVQSGFQIVLPMGFTSVKDGIRRYTTLTLLCCVSDQTDFATKQGDFMVPEFTAEAQEDINGDVFQWDFSEAS